MGNEVLVILGVYLWSVVDSVSEILMIGGIVAGVLALSIWLPYTEAGENKKATDSYTPKMFKAIKYSIIAILISVLLPSSEKIPYIVAAPYAYKATINAVDSNATQQALLIPEKIFSAMNKGLNKANKLLEEVE